MKKVYKFHNEYKYNTIISEHISFNVKNESKFIYNDYFQKYNIKCNSFKHTREHDAVFYWHKLMQDYRNNLIYVYHSFYNNRNKEYNNSKGYNKIIFFNNNRGLNIKKFFNPKQLSRAIIKNYPKDYIKFYS